MAQLPDRESTLHEADLTAPSFGQGCLTHLAVVQCNLPCRVAHADLRQPGVTPPRYCSE